MKKCFLSLFVALVCIGCQNDEVVGKISPLELSFQESKYRLTMGVSQSIEFTVSGIDGASVEASVELRSDAWDAECSLDQMSGKGILKVTPPESIGVTVAEVSVVDRENGREATKMIPLASTADGMELVLSFTGESYTVSAGGESIEMDFTIEGIFSAVLDTPVEGDVNTTLTVESLTYDAENACGKIKIKALETHQTGRAAVSLTVRDDWFREVTATVYINVTSLSSLPHSWNCYILKPGQTLSFSKKYLSVNTVTLAWQDAPDLIKSLNLEDDNVKVTSKSGGAGNALVLGKNSEGNTVWSWHIWVTEFDPVATAVTIDGFTFMDRNLGAVNATAGDVGAIGQAYQWGRKDPMPRVASITLNADSPTTSPGYYDIYEADGTPIVEDAGDNKYYKTLGAADMSVAIANPDYFITAASNRAWWTATDNSHVDWWGGDSGTKSDYDPCPEGWKVPVIVNGTNPYQFVLSEKAVYDSANFGLMYTDGDDSLWFPSNGQRSRSKGWIHNPYNDGNYWLGSDMDDDSYSRSAFMQFSAAGKGLSEKVAREVYTVLGCAVRCVKE